MEAPRLARELGPPRPADPVASVVIVMWRWDPDVSDALRALCGQVGAEFEVILVDNGSDSLDHIQAIEHLPPVLYLGFSSNRGASAGRNAGAAYSQAEIVIFVDDDAESAPSLVASHVAAYEDSSVIGVRGRILHKSKRFLNRADIVGDLGPAPIEALLDVEGNCSVRRLPFSEVRGFDDALFGHEGLDLSLRLLDRFGAGCLRYAPGALVYHEFADSIWHYLRKSYRHGRMAPAVDMRRIRQIQPPHASPWSDPGVLPLRLAGRAMSEVGRLWSRARGLPGPGSRLQRY